MRERRRRGTPSSSTAVSTSGRPGFAKVVLGTTNFCAVLLAEKPQLSTCQASGEQIIIKRALFPQGEGGKIRDPNGIGCQPGKATSLYSLLLPQGASFTPHLRESQVLRLTAK